MNDYTAKTPPARLSLTLWASAALLLAAAASAMALWYLKRVSERTAHAFAMQTVQERGEQVADYVAGLSPASKTELTPAQWLALRYLTDGLRVAQPEMQSVSFSRDGIFFFVHQAQDLAGNSAGAVPIRSRIEFENLEMGGKSVPVMVFRRRIGASNDPHRVSVEVKYGLAAVKAEEKIAARALNSLFSLSVLAVLAGFGACLLLLVWVVRRDRAWAERRRQEEHLAFSGMLANGIVHDFRNPMNSVQLDAQMLERETRRGEGPRTERLADLAGRISRTVGRMDKVFQEFLYMARPADEPPEPVDLAECVRECVETLAPRFEQAGVTPATVWAAPPPAAMASPFALRRALLNVMMNAVQFAPAGSRVEVDAAVTEGRIALDVLDRGPGIPRRQRRRVFEMFVTTRPGGTGLGLFLARTAVRKCGGDIAALERPGGGTVIRITLKKAAA